MAQLEVIDFAPFLADEGWVVGDAPTEAQRAVAAAIDAACRESGFIYLTSLGIPAQTVDAAFVASRALFALPETEKLERLPRVSPATNAGYMPFGGERLNRRRGADLKEAFNVKFPGSALGGCGLDAAVPREFAEAAEALWRAVEKLSERYCLACALALGVERDFFLRTFETMDMSTCRYLHYPPCADDDDAAARCHATDSPIDGSASSSVRLGEHTDFGMFTVLLTDGVDGLQLKPVEGGEVAAGGEAGGWRDVIVPAGGLGAVINTGALLARWTNDEWRATAHRVVVSSVEVARAHRYSIAFFMDPDAAAPIDVHPRLLRAGEAAKYAPTTGREYVMMKLKEAMTQ